MSGLTHLDDKGQAHMVDVGAKAVTGRVAVASGAIILGAATLAAIRSGTAAKGDVLATARIAGIMAAKRTHELIPLCHPLLISKAGVEFTFDEDLPGIRVTATVAVLGQTGVEMEAMTAVSVACLTLYDMTKAIDKGSRITDIRLIEKTGGKSGHWRAP